MAVGAPNIGPSFGLKWNPRVLSNICAGVTSNIEIVTKGFSASKIGIIWEEEGGGAQGTGDPGLNREGGKGVDIGQFALQIEWGWWYPEFPCKKKC